MDEKKTGGQKDREKLSGYKETPMLSGTVKHGVQFGHYSGHHGDNQNQGKRKDKNLLVFSLNSQSNKWILENNNFSKMFKTLN